MHPAFDRLRLIRSSHIGPVSYARLIQHYGSAGETLRNFAEIQAKAGKRKPQLADPESIAAEIDKVERLGARFLFLDDPDYPFLLSQIHDAPPVLIWRGNLASTRQPNVAVIGARNASAASCRLARQLAHGLAEQGVCVVSGLAKGIDTAAHEGALEHATIGVIAGGIDVHYPPENAALQDKIAERGLLLAEQPPGTEPIARHFPYRNRIIAGLAQGTVVMEAAPRSGSLITARLAGEAGRHVMAVPGSPTDPRSRGCNVLIRDGATLIQTVDDILELIAPFDDRVLASPIAPSATAPPGDARPMPQMQRENGPASQQSVVDLLSETPVPVDELVRQSGLSAANVQMMLLELELAGRLTRHAGARVSVKAR